MSTNARVITVVSQFIVTKNGYYHEIYSLLIIANYSVDIQPLRQTLDPQTLNFTLSHVASDVVTYSTPWLHPWLIEGLFHYND